MDDAELTRLKERIDTWSGVTEISGAYAADIAGRLWGEVQRLHGRVVELERRLADRTVEFYE